jgi:hypothetical protein
MNRMFLAVAVLSLGGCEGIRSDSGPIDGRLGLRTQADVTDFHVKNHLRVTGALDAPTLQALELR